MKRKVITYLLIMLISSSIIPVSSFAKEEVVNGRDNCKYIFLDNDANIVEMGLNESKYVTYKCDYSKFSSIDSGLTNVGTAETDIHYYNDKLVFQINSLRNGDCEFHMEANKGKYKYILIININVN